MYNILDFRAIVKHAYFMGQDDEAIHCEDTDKTFNTWQFAAQQFLERYHDALFSDGMSPRQLIVCHDMGHEYRSKLFDEYKAKRKEREKSPVETEQIKQLTQWAKRFFGSIGATQIGVDGVEADDIIAWICQNTSEPCQVFTVDADLLQLVNSDTVVYLKLVPYTADDESHKGVPFAYTSLSKSILGDPSDDYGGVPQLGQVKFDKLMADYGAAGLAMLQDIIDRNDDQQLEQALEENPDKTLIKLKENFSTWRKMWMLAKLHPELCWKPRAGSLTKPHVHKRIASAAHTEKLLQTVGAEDFWESTFSDMMPRSFAITAGNWEDMLGDIVEEMAKGDVVAFDYETADKEPHQPFREASSRDTFVDVLSQELTGASFQFGAHLENSIYVTVDHADADNLPVSAIATLLDKARQNSQLVAHNAFFEGVVSQTNLGMALADVHDTRIMQRYFDENERAGLKHISKLYLGYEQDSFLDTLGEKAHMAELTLDEVMKYGIDDSLVTGSLYDLLKLMLQLDGQWEFYCQWAVKPTEVLQKSYIKGVDVNWVLQKRIHEDDIHTYTTSVAKLRELLEENVSGEVTEGCKSFIEAEKGYITKGYRRDFRDKDGLEGDALSSAVQGKVDTWKAKFEAACTYHPYVETEEMPKFSPTPKRISEGLEAVGLPALEKASHKAVTDYLIELDVIGAPNLDDFEDDQKEVLLALVDALESDVFRMSSMRSSLKTAYESDNDDKAEKLESQLESAEEAVQALGKVCQKVAGVEAKVTKTGDELSIGSPQQMQMLLYCKIGVPVRLFGTSLGMGRIKLGVDTASPSTDEKAIQTALANDIEEGSWKEQALKLLLNAKNSLTKINLYHKKYPLWVHPIDGKVHPSFTDAGTDTRRPTGSAPNMLQVSKKDKEMRQMFHGPTPDHVTVAIDYASQEIRLMACEANDPVMMSVYDPANEKDLHSMTGSGVAGLTYDVFIEALKDPDHKLHPMVEGMRKSAKAINFGLAYGAGAGTLSRNMIVAFAEAKGLLDDAFSLYQRIKPWQEETAQFMNRNGFTITAFGTKRHATDDLFNKDKGKVARQHRQGTNATIQGAAAEMLRIVLTKMASSDMLNRLDMVFFAPIYDEVVSFVHKDDVYQYCLEMRDIMESATPPTHSVPQVPEFSIGGTWGTVKELGRWPGREAIEAATEEALQENAS